MGVSLTCVTFIPVVLPPKAAGSLLSTRHACGHLCGKTPPVSLESSHAGPLPLAIGRIRTDFEAVKFGDFMSIEIVLG
jgi:hypothetical protein